MSTVLPLARLLSRPARQGRAAIALPVVAFAVTTALLLVVAGGARMFLVIPGPEPRAGCTASWPSSPWCCSRCP